MSMEIKIKGDINKKNSLSIMNCLMNYINKDYEKNKKNTLGRYASSILYRFSWEGTPLEKMNRTFTVLCYRTKKFWIADVRLE